MKHKLFLLAVIISASSFLTPPKKVVKKNLPEPFEYTVGTLDRNGKVGKLEKSTAFHKSIVRIPIHTISGAKSSRRIRINDAVFDASADNVSSRLDPSYYIFLYKLEQGTDRRTFTENLNTNEASRNPSLIPIIIVKNDDSYRITVQGALFKGEYAFVDKSTLTDTQVTIWTFGID